jgi:hypothetical protein
MARLVRTTRPTAIVCCALVALVVASHAEAQLACGDTVTTSATLTADLVCDATAGPVVTVGAGAKLDLAGHAIRCTAGASPGIQVSGNGATVRGGVVQGCVTAINVAGDGNRVRDVVVAFAANTAYGIRLAGNGNLVRRCALGGALTDAVEIAGNANRIVRNIGVGGGEANFKVASGSDNVLVDNVAYFANANGFLLGQTAQRTVLRDNVAVVGQDGFHIGGTDHRLVRNVALDQQSAGFAMVFDSTGSRLRHNTASFSEEGFDIVGASSLLSDNAAFGSDTLGIVLRGALNTATHNLAIGNLTYDLSDTSSCQNTWTQNRFATADAMCVQ